MHTSFGEGSKMNTSQLVKNVEIADARCSPSVILGAINKVAPFAIRFMVSDGLLKVVDLVD